MYFWYLQGVSASDYASYADWQICWHPGMYHLFWEAAKIGLNQTKNGQKLVKDQFTPSRYPESRVTRAAEARAAAARMRASLVSMVAVVAGRGATRYWPGAGPAPCYRIPTLGPAQTLGSKEQYCNYHNSGSVFSGDWRLEEEPGTKKKLFRQTTGNTSSDDTKIILNCKLIYLFYNWWFWSQKIK